MQVSFIKLDETYQYIMPLLQANSKPPHPVRGGIPICFPQVSLICNLWTWMIWSPFLIIILLSHKSLALEGRLSNTVLQETRCGLWKRIHLLYLHSTQLTKPISTWYLNPLMKTQQGSGLTGWILLWLLRYIYIWSSLFPSFQIAYNNHSCFSFEFHLRVSLALDGNLTLISRVRNINSKPFSFSIAYHTYFSISDIRWRHRALASL